MQQLRAYRRCHVCGNTCEAPRQVRKCETCGKAFAPFYYFDDHNTPVQNEGNLRSNESEGHWRPIQGLTAYWQLD